jgi:hypothetical protein
MRRRQRNKFARVVVDLFGDGRAGKKARNGPEVGILFVLVQVVEWGRGGGLTMQKGIYGWIR